MLINDFVTTNFAHVPRQNQFLIFMRFDANDNDHGLLHSSVMSVSVCLSVCLFAPVLSRQEAQLLLGWPTVLPISQGGDTAMPRETRARLCHAFLVSDLILGILSSYDIDV